MADRVWEKSYPPGLSWDAPLPPAIAFENYLTQAADKWPDRTVIDFYGRRISFKEAHELSTRVAAGLQSLGVGPGANVGLFLPNTPHYLVFLFGTLMAGGTVVNFGPLTGPREFSRQLADADIRVMVTIDMPMYYSRIADLMGTEKLETMILCGIEDFLDADGSKRLNPAKSRRRETAGRQIPFAEFADNDGAYISHPRGKLEEEVAVLQYTGGTTGEPKGAMLTHANFSAVLNLGGRVSAAFFGDRMPVDMPPLKMLVAMPLCHITGFVSAILGPMISGAEIILHLRFDAATVLEDIEGKGVQAFIGVPAMYAALISHPDFSKRSLGSLMGWSVGGAAMPRDTENRFREQIKTPLHEGYGLTETTGYATFQFAGAGGREGPKVVGLPAPLTTIEIVDLETGMEVLRPGREGEICISGPQVMLGYWNEPEATQAAFRGGRFHTGDVGVLSEEGYLSILDRKKDMILTGGFNVYPVRIENAIYEHPSVAEVAVIGVDHPSFGQIAKAFIVLQDGAERLTHSQLLDFLSDKLSKVEMPLEMEIRTELPKTHVGKMAKRDLRAP